MSDRLSVAHQMRAFDSKNRQFYDNLNQEERRKFSVFLMMKYGANVDSNRDLQEWYLRVHNERVNTNFFDIGRHPKLQWLLCTTVSPDMGSQKHYWLSTKKKETDNRSKKFLELLHPELNEQEISLLDAMTDRDQLREYAQKLGWDDRRIEREL